MKTLCLEFSSLQRSAAVVVSREDGTIAQEVEVVESGSRTTRALGMIDDALRQAGLEREQIEALAVGLGPGSYTGIRAAIAVAQGWQLGGGTRVTGVSSADALAAEAWEQGWRGRLAAVIDAQRNEFYLADYDLGPEDWREVEPLRLATPEQVRACSTKGRLLAGPELQKWVPEARELFPRATGLGRLAAARARFVPAEKLEPIYLRETAFVKAPPLRAVPE